MSYVLDFSLALGSSKTGLTLNAQLYDSDLVAVGSAISSGFSEVGNGFYLWHYEEFVEGFRGGVKFYAQGSPSTVLCFISINPQETEIGNSSDEISVNVGHSNINIENSTETPVGNNITIGITTGLESLNPSVVQNNKEVASTENINITHGVSSTDSPIKITTGIR